MMRQEEEGGLEEKISKQMQCYQQYWVLLQKQEIFFNTTDKVDKRRQNVLPPFC